MKAKSLGESADFVTKGRDFFRGCVRRHLSLPLYVSVSLFLSRGKAEREFFIENLLVRIHFIIEMIWWTGLAPLEFEFPFPGSLTSTFQGQADLVAQRRDLLEGRGQHVCAVDVLVDRAQGVVEQVRNVALPTQVFFIIILMVRCQTLFSIQIDGESDRESSPGG